MFPTDDYLVPKDVACGFNPTHAIPVQLKPLQAVPAPAAS
jgi:hypothetical protein